MDRFTLVQIDENDGSKPLVASWSPSPYEQPGLTTTHKIVGVTMTYADENDLTQVAVMRRGVMHNVVSVLSQAWAIGDALWSNELAQATNVRPPAPLPTVFLGVVYADNMDSTWDVAVNVHEIDSLGEMSGVKLETPVDTDVFVYDSGSNSWVPRLLFAEKPGGVASTTQPNDGEVLYWDTTNKQALGLPALVFDDSAITLKIKAGASQAANLQEWQNSSGVPLSRIDKDGQTTDFVLAGQIFGS